MRDVLTTIQADQDTIIRVDSRGAHIVDGGPGTGTGKTVVALYRSEITTSSSAGPTSTAKSQRQSAQAN